MSNSILTLNSHKVYVRNAKPEHKLLKPAGWAWNVEFIEEWKRKKVEYIAVVANWEKKVYVVPLETFLQKAIVLNRGFGIQLALPEQYWRVVPLNSELSLQEQVLEERVELQKQKNKGVNEVCTSRKRQFTRTLF